MTAEESYRAPAAAARAEVRDRGSRFLALVSPAASEEAALQAVAAARCEFPDATHHAWAWRCGAPPRTRASDDGEPAGTAGAPILRALDAAGLADGVVVVVRWFGGTKLGKGGLARAYAEAAKAALAALPVVERFAAEELSVEVPLGRAGAVKRLLRPGEVELLEEEYGARAFLRLRVRRARAAALRAALADLGALVDARRHGR